MKENVKDTTFKVILSNHLLSALLQHFWEDPHMGVIIEHFKDLTVQRLGSMVLICHAEGPGLGVAVHPYCRSQDKNWWIASGRCCNTCAKSKCADQMRSRLRLRKNHFYKQFTVRFQ